MFYCYVDGLSVITFNNKGTLSLILPLATLCTYPFFPFKQTGVSCSVTVASIKDKIRCSQFFITSVITYFFIFTWTYLSNGVSPFTCYWIVLSALDDRNHYWQVQCPPADMSLNPFAIILPFPPSLSFPSSNRGAVCNVLLTCCKDSVCRLWAETLLPGDSLLSNHHNNHIAGQHSDTLGCVGPSRKNTCNGKTQGRTAQEVR